MNKRAARETALKGETSIGHLRALIDGAKGRGGMSRVNPQFTLEAVLDIFDGAIAGRQDDEVPRGMKPDLYSRTGKMKATRDALLITNILREVG